MNDLEFGTLAQALESSRFQVHPRKYFARVAGSFYVRSWTI
jgi:hypothetical protein